MSVFPASQDRLVTGVTLATVLLLVGMAVGFAGLLVSGERPAWQRAVFAGIALMVSDGIHSRDRLDLLMKRLVLAGELGELLHVEGHFSNENSSSNFAPWRHDAEESPAGGMTGSGIHVLDAFVSLLGPRYTHGHVIDFWRQLRRDPTRLEVLGNGKQKKSYLHVLDCVAAMFVAIVWHANRRIAADRERQLIGEKNSRLLEAQRRFLQDASHHLRTPITIALTHAELLARDLDGRELRDIQTVLGEITRLRRLSERLREELARFPAGANGSKPW